MQTVTITNTSNGGTSGRRPRRSDRWRDDRASVSADAAGVVHLDVERDALGRQRLRRYMRGNVTLYRCEVEHDTAGNVVSEQTSGSVVVNGRNWSLGYNLRHELVEVDKPSGQTDLTWGLDKVGNWTSTNQNNPGGAAETRTVTDDNEYDAIANPSATTEHDHRGRMTRYGDYKYTYNWNSRLIKVEKHNGVDFDDVATYTYDALDRLASRRAYANRIKTEHLESTVEGGAT